MADVTPLDAGSGKVDGRTARAVRTREALLDAVLALLDEGDVRPTAPKIAERAGVSLRSVFQHFADLDSLFLAVAQRQTQRYHDLYAATVPTGLPPAARAAAFCDRRAQLFEAIAPVRRAAELHEAENDGLARMLTLSRRALRSQAAATFADVLDARPAERRRVLLDALDVATSFSAWSHARLRMGHSRGTVLTAMTATVQALVS